MEQTNKPTAAERRRERLRVRIIEGAIELYIENGGENGGFEATTVESIADRADISLRTFFRYFESKQDVIYLDYRRAVEDMEGFVRKRLAKESPERAALHGSMDQIMSFAGSKVNRARIVRALKSPNFTDRRSVWRHHAQQKLASLLEPHMADAAEPAVAARVTAMIVRGAVDIGLERWAEKPAADPIAYILGTLIEARSAMSAMLGDEAADSLFTQLRAVHS